MAIWIFRRTIGFGHDAFAVWLILGICSAAVVIGVAAGIMTRCGGRTPYLVLLPETLSSPKLSAPIAWRDVENWGVVFGTRFGLDLIWRTASRYLTRSALRGGPGSTSASAW